jgi:GDP-L-fucose synthase
MFNGKNVLVAGGAGFVGVNLIKRLLERGANIRATLHTRGAVLKDDRIAYVKCDLTNREDCIRVVKDIDYVFMCAANTSGAAVIERTPLVHVTPNVIMNTLMLEAAYTEKVEKFLWISSNTVYPETDYPVREDEMMRGELYEKYFFVGWMKRFTEIVCEMYAQKLKNPMKVVVVRPANIYGEYDDFDWETSHVIPALIRKSVERHDPIEVWGGGKDIKDLIYVGDFIRGVLLAMEKIDTYDPINIGTGKPCSIRQALDAILIADNYTNAKVVFNSSKPTMIPKRLIDVSKARELLGFEATTSFLDGVKKTVAWYRKTHRTSCD